MSLYRPIAQHMNFHYFVEDRDPDETEHWDEIVRRAQKIEETPTLQDAHLHAYGQAGDFNR